MRTLIFSALGWIIGAFIFKTFELLYNRKHCKKEKNAAAQRENKKNNITFEEKHDDVTNQKTKTRDE